MPPLISGLNYVRFKLIYSAASRHCRDSKISDMSCFIIIGLGRDNDLIKSDIVSYSELSGFFA